MTGNAFADIMLAVFATFVIAAVAFILIVRDYALKYRKVLEEREKVARETPVKRRISLVGSHVILRDDNGVEHDAVVTAVHNRKMLTLAFIGADGIDIDQYFRDIEKGLYATPVSMHQMSGHIYGYSDDEPSARGVAEKYNQLHDFSHFN